MCWDGSNLFLVDVNPNAFDDTFNGGQDGFLIIAKSGAPIDPKHRLIQRYRHDRVFVGNPSTASDDE